MTLASHMQKLLDVSCLDVCNNACANTLMRYAKGVLDVRMGEAKVPLPVAEDYLGDL